MQQHLDVADWIVVGAFFVALLGLIAWVISYAVWTHGDWRHSREGRHLMTFRSTLAVFMAMGVTNSIWTSYPGRDIVRSIVVPAFALAVLQGFRTLYLAQREGRELRRLARLEGRLYSVQDVLTDLGIPEVHSAPEHAALDVLRPDHE